MQPPPACLPATGSRRVLGGHWLALAGALDRTGDADTALAAARISLRFAYTRPAAAALCSLLGRASAAGQDAVVEAVTASVLAWRAAEAGDPMPALPPSALALLASAARRGTDLPAAAGRVQVALQGEHGLPEGTAAALARAMNAAVACADDERAAMRRIAGRFAAVCGEDPAPEAEGSQGSQGSQGSVEPSPAEQRSGAPKVDGGDEGGGADEDRGRSDGAAARSGSEAQAGDAGAGAGEVGEAESEANTPAGEAGSEEAETGEADGGGGAGSWWRLW